MKDVLADRGYLSKNNVAAIDRLGARPWIQPKVNVKYSPSRMGMHSAWKRMLGVWHENRELFLDFYNYRPQVESVFSAHKRKFGDLCRCKSQETQEAEIITKLVCYHAATLAKTLMF